MSKQMFLNKIYQLIIFNIASFQKKIKSIKFNIKLYFSTEKIIALQKIIQAISGLVTLFLVTHYLKPEELGYFYTMGSLVSGYIIFELGLSTYILQRSAEISNKINIKKIQKINEYNGNDYLLAIIDWIYNYYFKIALITIIVLLPVGFYVLSNVQSAIGNKEWIFPWILMVLSVGASITTIGFMALLEGIGLIREVYSLRIVNYFIGSIICWLLIINNLAFYALAVPFLATTIVCYIWFYRNFNYLFVNRINHKNFNISNEFKSQIGHTSSILFAEYIYLNAPIVLAFYYINPIYAGEIGVVIRMANVWGAISMSSLTAKYPKIIENISNNLQTFAKFIFISEYKKFLFLYTLGSLILILVKYFNTDNSIISRMPEIRQILLIMFSYLLFHSSNLFIIYLRAVGIRASNQIYIGILGYTLLSTLFIFFSLDNTIFPILFIFLFSLFFSIHKFIKI